MKESPPVAGTGAGAGSVHVFPEISADQRAKEVKALENWTPRVNYGSWAAVAWYCGTLFTLFLPREFDEAVRQRVITFFEEAFPTYILCGVCAKHYAEYFRPTIRNHVQSKYDVVKWFAEVHKEVSRVNGGGNSTMEFEAMLNHYRDVERVGLALRLALDAPEWDAKAAAVAFNAANPQTGTSTKMFPLSSALTSRYTKQSRAARASQEGSATGASDKSYPFYATFVLLSALFAVVVGVFLFRRYKNTREKVGTGS